MWEGADVGQWEAGPDALTEMRMVFSDTDQGEEEPVYKLSGTAWAFVRMWLCAAQIRQVEDNEESGLHHTIESIRIAVRVLLLYPTHSLSFRIQMVPQSGWGLMLADAIGQPHSASSTV